MRVSHLLLIVHENELGEVVVHRPPHQVLAGRELVALGERLAPERLVDLAAVAPGAAPVLPALDAGGDLLEIGKQHAVRHEARRPMRDRGRDARVDGSCLGCGFGHERVFGLESRHYRVLPTSVSSRTALKHALRPWHWSCSLSWRGP